MAKPVLAVQNNLNERLVAIEIIRQVLLLRYSLHVRQLVVDSLNNTEEPIARMVREALQTDAGLRDPAQVRQLDRLIDQINAIRAPAWAAGRDAVAGELADLEQDEPKDQALLFAFLLPGVAAMVAPQIAGRAVNAPFQGRTLRQWFDDAQTDEAKRIRQAVYLGTAAGESPATVARRIVGTAFAKGSDGATQTSRNHADTIVRSAVISVSSQARDLFYQANSNILTTEQFVAVLDSRTTQLCRGLDGSRYKVGDGPIPPLHLNCRSLRVVVLPENLGGPVWEPEVYAAWIRKQPKAVLVELLGATRAAQVAKGVEPGAFVDYGAKPMTLKQIRAAAKRLMGSYSK